MAAWSCIRGGVPPNGWRCGRGTSTLATDAGIGGVTALTPARLVTEASFPVDAASFVWQALQHGWLPVPATPVGHLHDERRGRYDSVAIRLHAVR